MPRFIRRSLLVQLLGAYLLFVAAIFAADLKINAVAEQQVTAEVQTTDLALAQETAQDTQTELQSAVQTLRKLSHLRAVRQGNVAAMSQVFGTLHTVRPDIDLVYWLDARGKLRVSVPRDARTLGQDFSTNTVFTRATRSSGPVVQDGIIDFTTYNAAITLALAVRDRSGTLVGVLCTNFPVDNLREPIVSVVASQAKQHQHVLISILDADGRLIGTDQRPLLFQPMAGQLPGARDALAGRVVTRQGTDAQGQQWLYSSVPIRGLGWAVVVQRSAADALEVITNFRRWVAAAAVIFALGGLLFWLVLLRRVVQPLHVLARRHSSLSGGRDSEGTAQPLTARDDEIGGLARSLERLERDVIAQLGELHTLVETSSAVVKSLDPSYVGNTIIREVRRLVNIQAAAVLVPDADGVLRVLVSEGRDQTYDQAVHVPVEDLSYPSALALHEDRPVQMIAGRDEQFPRRAYENGFRSVLAIPITSHVGGVALVVQRTDAQSFTEREINLLLTFANHAALAWEHAVLYERSDERLREVAREREILYLQAVAEKRTQEAIVRSMDDGLILTSVDGRVLLANPGALAAIGLTTPLEGASIDVVYAALRARARNMATCDDSLRRMQSGDMASCLAEIEMDGQYRALSLRLFDVRDDDSQIVGRGLLLRDVTREREVDQMKTTLLDAVGHEFRTPLSSIKGYVSSLLRSDVTWSPEDERHFLDAISSESDRLALLVSSLLDLSRIEAGLLTLHLSPHRLEDLVGNAARRLHAHTPEFAVHVEPQMPSVEVDAARIEVVLHNLLANALAYGGGRVDISAESRDGLVIVHLADDGPGMAPDEVPNIFERFYRAGHGNQKRSGGTGLGLAICKAFVEAHGGSIWVNSGLTGTTISFSVPAATPDPPVTGVDIEDLSTSTGPSPSPNVAPLGGRKTRGRQRDRAHHE